MARKKSESVSLWHPWSEPEKIQHKLALYNDFNFQSADEAMEVLTGGKYYALVNDVLDETEVEESIVRDERSEPYLSRSGNVAALRIRGKRGSSFLVPGIQWCDERYPTQNTIDEIRSIFSIFKREALTPSSLSEKILRATLPDRLYISRPSVALRRCILENRSIARITRLKRGVKSPEAYEYDKIKAYLAIAASGVPSPFNAPVRFYHSSIWKDSAISWLKVRMTAHVKKGKIQPVQLLDEYGTGRSPSDGEFFEMWLWSNRIDDCLNSGYTLEEVEQGYSWDSLSCFMSEWANILFETCEKYKQESFYPILKRMTQGLPGRFLKAPEIYTLVHISEYQDGDKPLTRNWDGTQSPMSNWFMRVDKESDAARETAQLTPIGDFIVSECERQMYRAALSEEEAGNKVLRIYVDSLTTTQVATTLEVANKPGAFKVKRYFKAKFVGNRFAGYDEYGVLVVKAPGLEKHSAHRSEFIKEDIPCLNSS